MRRRYKGRETPILKLCQKLRQRSPTLTDAPDAKTKHFQRWPTPTDASRALAKQALSQLSYGPVELLFRSAKPFLAGLGFM